MSVIFERKLSDGTLGRLGVARAVQGCWKFYPSVGGRRPSSKFHKTMEACLPEWINYPDGCQSRIVETAEKK